jgi:lysophospholipid acyltransferase (LPLAT)-like uncharacterized protein
MLKLKHRILNRLISLVASTWRIRIIGDIPQKPAIVVFWHGFMLPVWKFFSKLNPIAVVSLSKDGEILSNLLESWNYRLIRGSSSSKGKEVLENIIIEAKNNILLITPDGPQGPIYKFKTGAVVSAQRASVPLILCEVNINKRIVFKKSWDKFSFPLPFTEINLVLSEPISIPINSTHDEINSYICDCEKNLSNLKNTEII